MLPVSNDFKLAMKQPVKELQAYIDENGTAIRGDDDLISFKISCDTGLCKTAMRKLEATYTGEHNLLGKWVHAGYGVRLPSGTFEYLDYGSFLVSEQTVTKDTGVTSIVAYDKMVESMVPYQVLDVDYPVDLHTYTSKLCEACGLELGSEYFGNNRLPSYDSPLWEFSSGAFINSEGNIELPNLNSRARITFDWNKKDKFLYVQFVLASGGNYDFNLSYYDENGTRIGGNGNATEEQKDDDELFTVEFGGDNQYGNALQNAKYIELTFVRSNEYAPQPYAVKNIMADNYLDATKSVYVPYNTMNEWQITQELWENIDGITYRDILQQIAQATAST